MFAAIDEYVNRCTMLSSADTDYFHSILKPISIKKKSWLLREGDAADFVAYVVKGCLRKYCIDDDGAEIILQFAIEDWWVGDIASSTMLIPSPVYVQALEDSELLLIHHDDREELLRRVPAFERMFRLMIERSYVVLQDRFVATLTKPADERYLAFLEKYPGIAQRVPQHYIAAYLGITPEFLSRIRSRLAGKV